MKSFTIKALAVAAASVCGSAVVAGTAASSNYTYATEGLTASTAITLQPVTYTMGVSRTSAQDFTVVIKPQSGSTLDGSVCDSAKPAAVTGAANDINNFTVSLKRQSASECAYEVDITGANGSSTALALTFTGLKLATHGLATASTEKLSIGLWDQGESARIDNSNDVLVTVANSAAAISIATGKDTGTVADVNHGSGPLYGFAVESGGAPSDDADNAKARFYIVNNPNGYKIATGARDFDVRNLNDVTKVTVTVSGDFDGAALTNGAVTGFAVTNPASAAETVTMGGTSTATFTLAAGDFVASANQTVNLVFTSAKNKSLGTSRSFSVSAVVDNAVGADTTVSNSNFWEWAANAIELRSAFFNNDAANGNLTRFFFQNVGAAAGYQATCQSDADGNTVTYGTAKTGTLRAGQTAINASDICTFSGGKRGSITFTINAPAKNVKGVYQQAINGAAAGYIPLERPYKAGDF